MRNWKFFLVIAGIWCATGGLAISQETAPPNSDEALIRQAIESYVKAFNSRDAKALVSHWSPEGVYTSRTTGDQVVGREEMAKEFSTMLAGEAIPKLAVATESIQFISPNVALERGIATVTHTDDGVSESDYSVVYVKHGGKWLIDRVTEDEVNVEPSHYDRLQELEWLVGQWTDKGDVVTINSDCKWTKNKNYISRTYRITEDDEVTSSGLQIIGWDPKQQQIRSWLFDSSGGFVQGTWSKKNDRWMVQSVATLADGASGSFTAIFRPIDENSFGWQKVNRIVAGQLMPNVDEVVVTRD